MGSSKAMFVFYLPSSRRLEVNGLRTLFGVVTENRYVNNSNRSDGEGKEQNHQSVSVWWKKDDFVFVGTVFSLIF